MKKADKVSGKRLESELWDKVYGFYFEIKKWDCITGMRFYYEIGREGESAHQWRRWKARHTYSQNDNEPNEEDEWHSETLKNYKDIMTQRDWQFNFFLKPILIFKILFQRYFN